MILRYHVQTAGSSLTAQEPLNNIIRTTIEAIAAILGGCQSLHTNSYDEALSLPTETSVLVALRTQQIIAYETDIPDTVDPLAGSYFVESLTREIEERVWEYLEKIEAMGGAVEAVKMGYFQREIEESAYRYQTEVERGERLIVGVNIFRTSEEPQKIDLFSLSEEVQEEQKRRVREYKNRRGKGFLEALRTLKEKAKGSENLMPYIFECAKEGATLGEISDTLREVWGTYDELKT